jgi:hypothetical protein
MCSTEARRTILWCVPRVQGQLRGQTGSWRGLCNRKGRVGPAVAGAAWRALLPRAGLVRAPRQVRLTSAHPLPTTRRMCWVVNMVCNWTGSLGGCRTDAQRQGDPRQVFWADAPGPPPHPTGRS